MVSPHLLSTVFMISTKMAVDVNYFVNKTLPTRKSFPGHFDRNLAAIWDVSLGPTKRTYGHKGMIDVMMKRLSARQWRKSPLRGTNIYYPLPKVNILWMIIEIFERILIITFF